MDQGLAQGVIPKGRTNGQQPGNRRTGLWHQPHQQRGAGDISHLALKFGGGIHLPGQELLQGSGGDLHLGGVAVVAQTRGELPVHQQQHHVARQHRQQAGGLEVAADRNSWPGRRHQQPSGAPQN